LDGLVQILDAWTMVASAVLGEFGPGVVISGCSFVKIWMRGTVGTGQGMRVAAAAGSQICASVAVGDRNPCGRCCRR
jgi:hypothetical protein